MNPKPFEFREGSQGINAYNLVVREIQHSEVRGVFKTSEVRDARSDGVKMD